MRITVSRPAKTDGISRLFFSWKMNQPRPPEPELTPKTSSAAIKVRHAKAQATFKPLKQFTVAKYFGSLTEAQKVHFNDGGQFDKIYSAK